MSKDIEKNRNSKIAGRYWAITPTKTLRLDGINNNTTVAEARRIAAANMRLIAAIRPLPLGKS